MINSLGRNVKQELPRNYRREDRAIEVVVLYTFMFIVQFTTGSNPQPYILLRDLYSF